MKAVCFPAMTTSLLCPDAFLSPLEIDAVVTRALTEDLGRAGDVTSIATIPESAQARAVVVAREAGVISGLPLAAAAFAKLAPETTISAHARDGARVAEKTTLMTIEGPARAVLAAERLALNLLGHLSGVATARTRRNGVIRNRRRNPRASSWKPRRSSSRQISISSATSRLGAEWVIQPDEA